MATSQVERLMNLASQLSALLQTAVKNSFPQDDVLNIIEKLCVTPASRPQFGHYQFNHAMQLAKILKQNPHQVANTIIDNINDPTNIFAKLEIAGPGFINITLARGFINAQANLALAKIAKHITNNSPQNIIVDYASPNVAKEMHVGHLRSTVIGDAIANIHEYLGHKVTRINHLGDWGTAFGMLIAWIEQENIDQETLLNVKVATTVTWYKQAKLKFDGDPDFKQQSHQAVVRLQQGEKKADAIWKSLCKLSEYSYQEIFSTLGVKLITRGESSYQKLIPPVIKELHDKKMVTQSDGALCIFDQQFTGRDNEVLPLIIVKSDGGYNYASTDLAAIYQRSQLDNADQIIYVTDLGQRLHFSMVFAAAQRANWLKTSEVKHVGFGLVLGPDGKKFKTRSGDTVALSHLLNEAVSHALHALRNTNPNATQSDANILGIGAIKYADLSTVRTTDYKFNLDSMLSLEGNTIAFIMYSFVRGLRIMEKSECQPEQIACTEATEEALLVKLLMLTESVEQAAKRAEPHILCEYIYQLACLFNGFIRDCRIRGDENEKARLAIISLFLQTTATVLKLLGIQTIKQM